MSIIQEHFESKDVQARQEHPFMYLLGQAIGWVVRTIFGFIRWSWLSILWVCAAVLLMKAISGFWGYCCAARSDFCSSDSAVFLRCSRLAKVSGTPIRGEGS